MAVLSYRVAHYIFFGCNSFCGHNATHSSGCSITVRRQLRSPFFSVSNQTSQIYLKCVGQPANGAASDWQAKLRALQRSSPIADWITCFAERVLSLCQPRFL